MMGRGRAAGADLWGPRSRSLLAALAALLFYSLSFGFGVTPALGSGLSHQAVEDRAPFGNLQISLVLPSVFDLSGARLEIVLANQDSEVESHTTPLRFLMSDDAHQVAIGLFPRVPAGEYRVSLRSESILSPDGSALALRNVNVEESPKESLGSGSEDLSARLREVFLQVEDSAGAAVENFVIVTQCPESGLYDRQIHRRGDRSRVWLSGGPIQCTIFGPEGQWRDKVLKAGSMPVRLQAAAGGTVRLTVTIENWGDRRREDLMVLSLSDSVSQRIDHMFQVDAGHFVTELPHSGPWELFLAGPPSGEQIMGPSGLRVG